MHQAVSANNTHHEITKCPCLRITQSRTSNPTDFILSGASIIKVAAATDWCSPRLQYKCAVKSSLCPFSLNALKATGRCLNTSGN